ncbi:MAG TPA: class I SAM-dependent methyltransferase [Pyrinomonadaceae bacterium]|nr:class I SAM-dependent methyltransferase [Pyrinomonadaceae bacterium]
MNYFSPKSAAQRYAKGRPYFHPMIIAHIKEFLSITRPLSSALDVGCGTGLSTVALKGIAENIIGLDASAEMIALAPEENGIRYFVAAAENLPFDNNDFDLLTLSQVFHWLDANRFLAEANRVLRPSAWLIAYDNYFSGQMVEHPEFHRCYEEYLARYPVPPRGKIAFSTENAELFGLHLVKEERHDNTVTFSLEGLVDYLVTQSNVIARVEGGSESIQEARSWLTRVIEPIFGSAGEKEFLFNAPIWYLQNGNATSQSWDASGRSVNFKDE